MSISSMNNGAFIKVYCVLELDGKVVMAQDVEGQRGWKFPGGHVEEGELIARAARREVSEETGYEVTFRYFLLAEDFFNHKRPNEHDMRFYFVCNVVGGTRNPKRDEVVALRDFNKKELASLSEDKVYPPHWNALQRYLRGEVFPVDILQVTEQ